MKKFTVVLFFILFFTSLSVFGQCPENPCIGNIVPGDTPDSACITCDLSSLDGYIGTTDYFNQNITPGPFCGSVENNQFIPFVAPQENVSFSIDANNCAGTIMGTGIQAEVYGSVNCSNDWVSVSNCASTGTMSPFSINATGLTPGGVYYLMVDGWAEDICDFEITVTNPVGGGSAPPLPTPGPITPTNNVCIPESGATSQTYSIPEVGGAQNYNWTSAGTFGIQDPINPNIYNVTFDTPGLIEICVEVTNACSTSPQFCQFITVTEIINPPTEFIGFCPGSDVICGGQLFSDPSPGPQTITLQSYLGCDSVITCELGYISIDDVDLPDRIECAPFCLDVCGEQFCETQSISKICTSYQGCDSMVNVNLFILDPLVSIAPPNQIGCDGNNGMITLDGSSSSAGPINGTTTYLWTGPSFCGPTNQTTACVDMVGEYCLMMTHEMNGVMCSDTVCVNVTENTQAPEAPTISAPPGPVCEGDTVTYTINNFSGAQPSGYTFTVTPNQPINVINANTFEVDWTGSAGGDICVIPESDCGDGPQACITVAISAGPVDPTFSGELMPCTDQTYSYTVDNPDPDATYSWTAIGAVVNDSGDMIDIDFGAAGNVEICVTSTNACGAGTPYCETVTVVGPPAIPAFLSGSTAICGSANEEYCVNNDPNAIDYSWATPVSNINNAGNCETIDWTGSNGGQICVTANNDCGSSQPFCFNVMLEEGPTAALSGMGLVCENGMDTVDLTVNFTGTGPWTFVYNDGNMDVTVMSNDATSFLPVFNAGNYTPVSVTDQTVCAGTVSGFATVTQNAQPTAVLSGTAAICENSGVPAILTITLTGTPPWTVNYTVNGTAVAPLTGLMNNTESLAIPEVQAGDIEITGVTDGNGCTNTGNGTVIPVVVNDAPIVSNIQTPCNVMNDGYNVIFEITGGDPMAYSVTPNMGTISASPPYIFTSNEIVSGTGYDFTVNDANNCNPVNVSQNSVNCACDTEVGTMAQMIMRVCGEGPLTAAYDNTNETSDADDVLVYYLHTGSGVSIVNPMATNPIEPTFSFMIGMTYGTTYYISAVNGNDDAMGGVDLDDSCTAVAQGTPVVFLELPTATLGEGVAVCTGQTADLAVTFTGTGPWNLVYDAGNGLDTISGINANPYNLGIIVTANTTVTLTSVISDYPAIDCEGMAAGTSTITTNTAVQVTGVNTNCNPMGTAYTVSFEIVDGDPASYSVVPAGGISAGPPYIFTSTPITVGMGYNFTVDDANNCSPATVSAPTVVCDCNTDVGVMNTDTLTVCGDELTMAVYDDTDQSFDGDDVLNFVMHTGSSTTLGNVLQTNPTDATFNFGGGMNYGTIYYISAIVGNDDGTGNVDVNDPCLDVAAGTPVVFYEVPTGNLTADASICNGENTTLSVALTGDAPWSLTITDDQGGNINQDNINTNPFTVMVSPTVTTVYTLSTISNESGCLGDAMGTTTITVNDVPTLTIPTFIFNGTNTGYTVSFEIMGGDPTTYAVTPANGTISAGPPYIFTSNEIPCGNGFNFSVEDANDCGPVVANQASVICNCNTEAGMMIPTADPLTACGNELIVAMYDGGETLDANDAASFVLLNGAMVLDSSTMPSFGYNQNNMTYGQIYQICAAAGDDNGTGIASQNDPCFDIGTVCVDIIFHETPTATLSGNGAICAGDSTEITVTFTGTPPYDFTYENNTSGTEFSQTGILTNTFDFFVTSAVTSSFSLVNAMDANGCEATLSGLSNIMVQNAPTAGQPTETCNVINTEFTVSFQVFGGDDASYTVAGTTMGIIDANGIFTSDPLPTGSNYSFLVDDGIGCGPFEVSGAFACDCETEVGTITENGLNLCEGETATITHNNPIFDPDDILVYILHDGTAVPFGNILQQSNTSNFDFAVGAMTFGTTYFFAALVGNDDGTGIVDENDPCFDLVEIPVVWNEIPNGMFGDDINYCGTSNIEIPFELPPGIFNIIIEDDNGNTFNANDIENGDVYILPNIGQTTIFTIVEINSPSTGCTGTSADEILVTINQAPNAGNNATSAFCEDSNEAIDLLAALGGSPDVGGTWSDDGGNVVPNGLTTTTGLAVGSYDYTYTLTGDAPCPAEISVITIEISAGPTADAGADQILTCAELTTVIGGINTTAGATYTWIGPAAVDNQNAANATANAPGIYTLTVTDADGCTATDQIEVTLDFGIPVPFITVANADCFGDNNGFISIDSIENGVSPYLYSFNGGAFSSNTTFTNLGAGENRIVIQDANGCEIEIIREVEQPEEVNVVLSSSIEGEPEGNTINLGDNIILTAITTPDFALLDSILWTPPLAVECDTCETNIVSPQSQTTYSVYVEVGGCSDTDQLTVFVGKGLEIYVPNVFSPNGDFQNDFVTIYGNSKIVENVNSFMIFNRWGESVHIAKDFTLNASELKWDGTFRGKPMDSQAFVWFAEILFVDGTTKLFKGDVTLIK